jgi:hypothetical protein
MYCQFCGQQVSAEVNYCKQCGVEIRASGGLFKRASFPNTTGIAMAIALLGTAGPAVVLGAAIPLLAENPGIGIMAMLFGFLVISVGLGALIRHMQKITKLAIQSSDRAALLAPPAQPQYIDAQSAVMTSVTENTTRSLECAGKAPAPDS